MVWDVSDDPVDFDEAVAWFRKRVKMTRAQRDALEEKAKRQAFFVSGVAQLDIVTDAWKALDKALKDGTPLEDFKKAIGPKLEAAWGGSVADPGHRLETIFRNNVQAAYSAGRYEQATNESVLEDRPVWMFDAILDGRETTVCRECDGTKLPADHEWWKTRVPPLHHRCRSTIITLTEEEAGELTKKPTTAKAQDGFGLPPDEREAAEALERWAHEKVTAAPPALAEIAPSKIPLRRTDIEFVDSIDPKKLKKELGCTVDGDLHGVSKKLFKGKCPSPESWKHVWEVPEGYEVKFTSFSAENGKLAVKADIYNSHGEMVVSGMDRDFRLDENGILRAHNAYLEVAAKAQKDKIGEHLSRSSIRAFMDIGVKFVDLEPAWIGRYTWASFGFSWDEREDATWKAKFRDYLIKVHKLDSDDVDEALKGVRGAAHELAKFDIPGLKVRTSEEIHGDDVRIEDVHVGKAFLLDNRWVSYPDFKGKLRLDDPDDVGLKRAKERLKI